MVDYSKPGEMMAHFKALEERVRHLEEIAPKAETPEEKMKILDEALEITKALANMARAKMERGDTR